MDSKKLKVDRAPNGRPSLTVPVEDVPRMRDAFKEHGVKYEVDDEAVREGGLPRLAVFDFDSEEDIGELQRVVDSAA